MVDPELRNEIYQTITDSFGIRPIICERVIYLSRPADRRAGVENVPNSLLLGEISLPCVTVRNPPRDVNRIHLSLHLFVDTASAAIVCVALGRTKPYAFDHGYGLLRAHGDLWRDAYRTIPLGDPDAFQPDKIAKVCGEAVVAVWDEFPERYFHGDYYVMGNVLQVEKPTDLNIDIGRYAVVFDRYSNVSVLVRHDVATFGSASRQ